MKFDVVVGNPPYDEAGIKDGARGEPVYHKFIQLTYEISDKSVLITPGRFLFNAGQTPRSWNEQMLADEHLKVIHYEQASSKIFSNTSIKGGIVVTYHDKNKKFGAINTFTLFEELDSILLKVENFDEISLTSIVFGTSNYQYTEKILEDFPELIGKITKSQIKTNAFDKLTQIFFDKKPENGEEYIQLIGRQNNERIYKWVRRDYVIDGTNLNKYKVILPNSNGTGAIGEVLSTPLIGEPLIGTTQTFITIGKFETLQESEFSLKYIKSKFTRTLLGVLKITQHNTPETWRKVPLQDFTANSDIDWTKSISEIDQQLYVKYGLSQDEIAFIEDNVRPME